MARFFRPAVDKVLKIYRTALFKAGTFCFGILTVLGFILFNYVHLLHLQQSAMRFVPAEAVSFIVVPDVKLFMSDALPAMLAIKDALQSPSDPPNDLVRLLTSAPSVPTPCTWIRSSGDLRANGIADDGSMSFTQLDTGARAAFGLTEEQKGLAFLTDTLLPTYVELQAGPIDTNDTPVTFSFQIESTDVGLCIDKDRSKVATGHVSLSQTVAGRTITFPLRLGDETGSASIKIQCTFSVQGAPPTACSCLLYGYRMGEGIKEPGSERDCSQPVDLSYARQFQNWRRAINSGNTVSIGDFYLAKIHEFYVVELSQSKQANSTYEIVEPLTSIIRDDSILKHFYEMSGVGMDFKTGVFAGARPDWIGAHSLSTEIFPLYLMTPISAHFSPDRIRIDAASNLEPEDLLVEQLLTERGDVEAGADWKSPTGLSATLTDRSLKVYADFTRRYAPSGEEDLETSVPLLPILVDFMEGGARSITAQVVEWNNALKQWSLLSVVPNITPDYASSLVERVRRRTVVRRAATMIDRAAQLAVKLGYDPKDDDFKRHVVDLTCPQSLWTLKEIHQHSSPGFFNSRFSKKLELNKTAISDYGPSTRPTRTAPQPLVPDDPNTAIWGPNGSAQPRIDKLDSALSDSALSDLRQQLQSDVEDIEKIRPESAIHTELKTVLKEPIDMATSFESKHDAVKDLRLAQRLRSIAQMLDGAKAREALKDLRGSLDDQNLRSALLLKAPDIQGECGKVAQRTSSAWVFFDLENSSLYVGDAPSDAIPTTQLVQGAGHVRDEAKFSFQVNNRKLTPLLEASNQFGKNDGDNVLSMTRRFPFPLLRVDIAGRADRVGVDVTVELEKGQRQK